MKNPRTQATGTQARASAAGRELINTAGEPEREALTRRSNLIEALAVMSLLLGTLWFVAYPFGVLLEMPAANTASRWIVAGLLVFALLISPRRHRDTFSSWGLGSPTGLLRTLRRAPLWEQLVFAGAAGAAIAVLTLQLYRNATGAARFILGVEPATTFNLQQTLGGKTVVLVICLVFAILWATCIVRYDNFWPALKAAATILAVLVPITLLTGWAANGSDLLLRAHPRALVRNGLGYIFWGAVQQLIFCSYFGTRLRKGFAPAAIPTRQAGKRFAVAALNGLFFSLMHLNSWLLVGFTWILGSFLSWFFMQDRYRNLQALGLVHGVLGTCVIWLFADNPAPVHIRLRVGPWSMRQQWLNLPTLMVVGLLVAGFLIAIALLARRDKPARTAGSLKPAN